LFPALYSALLDSVIVAVCTFFNNDSIREFQTSPAATGALVGSDTPNLNMKHHKSVEILLNFQNVLRKYKAPYLHFLGDGSGLNLTSFRAAVSLR